MSHLSKICEPALGGVAGVPNTAKWVLMDNLRVGQKAPSQLGAFFLPGKPGSQIAIALLGPVTSNPLLALVWRR